MPPVVCSCPNRMNPKSCPRCWNKALPPPKVVNPDIRPGIAMGVVVSMDQALASAAAAAQRSRASGRPAKASNDAPLPREAHREGNLSPPPEAHGNDKVWEPPVRASLIDQQPRHPHADKGTAQVLKR